MGRQISGETTWKGDFNFPAQNLFAVLFELRKMTL